MKKDILRKIPGTGPVLSSIDYQTEMKNQIKILKRLKRQKKKKRRKRLRRKQQKKLKRPRNGRKSGHKLKKKAEEKAAKKEAKDKHISSKIVQEVAGLLDEEENEDDCGIRMPFDLNGKVSLD